MSETKTVYTKQCDCQSSASRPGIVRGQSVDHDDGHTIFTFTMVPMACDECDTLNRPGFAGDSNA